MQYNSTLSPIVIQSRAQELSLLPQSELIALILSHEYNTNAEQITQWMKGSANSEIESANINSSPDTIMSDSSMDSNKNNNISHSSHPLADEIHSKHKHSDTESDNKTTNNNQDLNNGNNLDNSSINPKKKKKLQKSDLIAENKLLATLNNNSNNNNNSISIPSHSMRVMQLQTELRSKKPFDFSKYPQRHIALKFSYIGSEYNGFASQIHNERTVEAELFRALQLTCLIESRELCHYSRCGRTDKGVSAAGQVIALYLRSKVKEGLGVVQSEHLIAEKKLREVKNNKINKEELNEEENNLLEKATETCPTWNDAMIHDQNTEIDEYDYVNMLNKVLPPSIRILAWQPVPLTFSARFSCTHRVYKYYFYRDSMNISLMHSAAQQLVGSHDFRNFCKIDAANSVHFIRKLEYIHVKEINTEGSNSNNNNNGRSNVDGWAEIEVRGNAFLYHQVRCMAAILFYIGRGVEKPEIIADLLNIEKYPRKPVYDIASELPLVLYDTVFPNIQSTAPLSSPTIPFTVFSPAYPSRKQALINQQLLFIEFHSQWRELSLKAKIIESIMKGVENNLIEMRKLWKDLDQIVPIPTKKNTNKVGNENKNNNEEKKNLEINEEDYSNYLRGLQLTNVSRTFDFPRHIPLAKRKTEKSYQEMKELLSGKKKERNAKLEVMSVLYRGEFLKKATRLERNGNEFDPSHHYKNNNSNSNNSITNNNTSNSTMNDDSSSGSAMNTSN